VGAAQQGEIRAGSQAFMAIGIQTQSEDDSLLFLFVFLRHFCNLIASVPTSKWKRAPAFAGRITYFCVMSRGK